MPRLPDRDSLGARPTPRVQRSVATVRNRGGVAEAAAAFGAGVSDIAGKALERQDKLNYAAAKASLLKADIAARTELQDDPDFGTMEQRYNERMTKAREAASKLVQHKGDRGLFDQDIGVDIERGLGEVKKLVRDKRVSFETATFDGLEADMQDLGQGALDDGTREATLANYSAAVDGMVAKGIFNPEEAGKRKRGFAQNYSVQGIESAIDREDYPRARKLLEANRGRLDAVQETRLDGLLLGREQGREALTLADEYYNGPRSPVGIPEPGKKAPTEPLVLKPGDSARPTSKWTGVATSVASTFGLNPVEVAAVMSYETGGSFSPTVMGGKGGNYMGLIQFGREERAKYGITKTSSPEQWTTAITRFLKDRGFKRGMGVLDLYSTINAGTPGRYNASDGNGTVRTHVDALLSKHRGNAKRWLKAGGVEADGGEYTEATELPDIASIYDKIDTDAVAEGWTPEKTERIKTAVAKRVDRDRAILNQREDDAYDAAMTKAVDLAEDFTDVSQLGDAYAKASPQQRNTLQNMAQANASAVAAAARGEATAANGNVVRSLHRMAIMAPSEFANARLGQYRSSMTPGEFDELSTAQARAKEDIGKWSPRTGAQTVIEWGAKFGGVEIKDDSDRYRTYRYIEDRARQYRGETKGKTPTEDDYQRWFREAAQSYGESRAFEVLDAEGGITGPFRKMITRQFRAVKGRDPTEDEMQAWFDKMGRPIS